MIYGSVCSGIDAATQAWHPLGWVPAFFSEIEKFPSAVLAHHYGSNMPGEPWARNGVPNYGDMTNFEEWPDHAIDLLVGGTPCQSYSIAGLRKGLADPRGSLTLTYAAIARRYRPCWLAWENVPGVLSLNAGQDFAQFLGVLTGQQVSAPKDGWKSAGIITQGSQSAYGVAWRVLDAQYIRVDGFARAVPQRRRRVILVGYTGDWRPAAAVLLEPESLRGDPAPSRETGQDVAGTIDAGAGKRGQPEGERGQLVVSDVASCLDAHIGDKLGLENQHVNSGAPLFVAHALRGEGFDASEDGTGRGTPIVPVAFNSIQDPDVSGDISGPLNAGSPQQQAIAIQERAVSENPDAGPDGAGVRDDRAAYTLEARTVPQAVAHPVTAGMGASAARLPDEQGALVPELQPYSIMPMNSGKDFKARETDIAQPIMAGGPTGGNQGGDYIVQNAATRWAVRRLTPTECHRLQGFTDGYCNVPWRGKDHAPDGPQYKSLGNSMAVNKMRWLGRRIEMVQKLLKELGR